MFTKLVCLSVALQSLLSGLFLISSCKLEEYTKVIVPEAGTWIKSLNYRKLFNISTKINLYIFKTGATTELPLQKCNFSALNLSSPYHIYIITYYFVCSHSMGMGYEDIFTIKRHEIILDIIIIIAGK